MKTPFRLFFLIFVFAFCSINEAKTNDVKESSLFNEFSFTIQFDKIIVDTIPVIDSIALIELEEPTNPLDYMTIEEKGMIDEINLLRADPQAYARYIDGYTQSIVSDPALNSDDKMREMAIAGKLIIDLQTMEPLSALKPHYKLYELAKVRGADLVKMKNLELVGSDDAQQVQRIRDSTGLIGAEDVIHGYSSIRQTIISILIQGREGDQNRPLNILDHDWEYITCLKIGKVGEINNVWLQMFGFSLEQDEENSNGDIYMNTRGNLEEFVVKTTITPSVKKSGIESTDSFITLEEKEMIDNMNNCWVQLFATD